MPGEEGAQGPEQEAQAHRGEGDQQSDVIAGGFEEELGENQAGGIGVDEEVVPLDGGPDNGGERDSAVVPCRLGLLMRQSAHGVSFLGHNVVTRMLWFLMEC